eukprot:TRINITY_DN9628_c0_g1_i5.p1 TRINITY_DN9628_c0_g1~~TRINITY_DN9628_c0_g1_i5.p1  ORF type:complete len:558 (+),score=155.48 TRINITY_DN9628_c0_g1_i5:67-1740(+)
MCIRDRLSESKKNMEDEASDKEQMLKDEVDKEITELKAVQDKELEDEKMKCRQLQNDCLTKENKIEEEKAKITCDYTNFLKEMNEEHTEKQRATFDLNNEKAELLVKEKEDFKEEIVGVNNYIQDQLGRIEAAHEGKYDELKEIHAELQKESKADSVKFRQVLEQTEREYEHEIKDTESVFAVELQILRDNNEELRKDLERLKRNLKETNRATEEMKEEKDLYNSRNNDLKSKNNQLKLVIKKLKDKSRQYELLMQSKERDIRSFKSDKRKLEQHHTVLDNETELLKSKQHSLEEQIKTLEATIQFTYIALQAKFDNIQTLLHNKQTCKAKLTAAASQLQSKTDEFKSTEWKLGLLQNDLMNVLKGPVDLWPQSLPKTYSKYFSPHEPLLIPKANLYKKGESVRIALTEPGRKQEEEVKLKRNELVKEKTWLEGKLKATKGASDRSDVEKTEAVKRLQQQNGVLINDANKLQRSYGDLQKKVRKLEEKFTEVTGISLYNVQNVEKEVRKYMHPEMRAHQTFRSINKSDKALQEDNSDDITEETTEFLKTQVISVIKC